MQGLFLGHAPGVQYRRHVFDPVNERCFMVPILRLPVMLFQVLLEYDGKLLKERELPTLRRALDT